jgi:hypothetical protein
MWPCEISIAAIKPLHRRGFPSTEARKQNEGRAMAETGLTHAEAGVDLDTGDRLVEPFLGSTARADAAVADRGRLDL